MKILYLTYSPAPYRADLLDEMGKQCDLCVIFEKSRQENKGTDEMELLVLNSAGKLAAQIGMLVCCAVAVLQVAFTDSMSYESWMIYFSILGTLFTVKYIKLHEKHELLLAILFSGLVVFFTVLFVHRLVG